MTEGNMKYKVGDVLIRDEDGGVVKILGVCGLVCFRSLVGDFDYAYSLPQTEAELDDEGFELDDPEARKKKEVAELEARLKELRDEA